MWCLEYTEQTSRKSIAMPVSYPLKGVTTLRDHKKALSLATDLLSRQKGGKWDRFAQDPHLVWKESLP